MLSFLCAQLRMIRKGYGIGSSCFHYYAVVVLNLIRTKTVRVHPCHATKYQRCVPMYWMISRTHSLVHTFLIICTSACLASRHIYALLCSLATMMHSFAGMIVITSRDKKLSIFTLPSRSQRKSSQLLAYHHRQSPCYLTIVIIPYFMLNPSFLSKTGI